MEKFSDNPGQAAKQVDCINAARRYATNGLRQRIKRTIRLIRKKLGMRMKPI